MSLPVPTSPDCYWVLPGRFLAGEYPGHEDDAEAKRKLQSLADAGIRVFVDLTEAGEQDLRPYSQLLAILSPADEPMEYHRLSIRDVSTPSVATMRQIQQVIREAIAADRPAYVHCWGGTGRTGTVVGCWLLEQGHTEPLTRLQELRSNCAKRWRSSPDTLEQERFVHRWAERSIKSRGAADGVWDT